MTIRWEAVGGMLLPHVGSFANTYFTKNEVKTWYKGMKKPSWTPPDWVFGPVWAGLYTSMGYASYMVWRDGGGFSGAARTPLILYGTQLALNWSWPPVFFKMHCLKWSSVLLGGILVTATGTSILFHEVNPTASHLLLPYLAWLSYALSLNVGFWLLNSTPAIKDE